MEILPNLWQVGGNGLTAPNDAAIYLIRADNSAALIDAGTGEGHPQLIKNISACLTAGVSLDYLFLTHCHYDHTGGVVGIRDHFGCSVIAHALDAGYLESGDSIVTGASWYGSRMHPTAVDYKIDGQSETFSVGSREIQAYHCPGHSPGSVVFVSELAGKRVLFGQDVHGPLHPSFLSDRQAYEQSLRFILSLEADMLCEGHLGVFRGKETVARFIRSYLTEP